MNSVSDLMTAFVHLKKPHVCEFIFFFFFYVCRLLHFCAVRLTDVLLILYIIYFVFEFREFRGGGAEPFIHVLFT